MTYRVDCNGPEDMVWLEDPEYHTAGGQSYIPVSKVIGNWENLEQVALVLSSEETFDEDMQMARLIALALNLNRKTWLLGQALQGKI